MRAIKFFVLLFIILPGSLFASVMSITQNVPNSDLLLTVGVVGKAVEYTVTNTTPNHTALPGPFAMTYFPGSSVPAQISINAVTHSPPTADCTQITSLAYGSSCYFDLTITGIADTASAIVMRPSVCGYHGSGPCEVPTIDNALNINVSSAPSPAQGRTFTIANECPFQVSFGFVSGSVQAPLIPSSGGTVCSKTDPCASPYVCAYANSTATTGLCSPMKDIFCNPAYYNAHAADCDPTSGTQVCGACPSGASCSYTAGDIIGGVHTGLCFSSAPQITSPTSGSHILAAGSVGSPTTATAQLIAPLTTVDQKWSGGLFPRLMATSGSTVISSDCRADHDATQDCDLGQGPTPPFTGAEFTVLRASQDSYDVTLIDGPTIPVSMKPTTITQDPANPYLCGTPGDTVAHTGTSLSLPAATWSFTAPNNDVGYNFVFLTNDSVSCTNATAASVCTGSSAGGTTCGMGYDPTTGAISATTGPKCGTLLGHWGGGKACSFGNSYFNNLYSCTSNYSTGHYTDLYQCNSVAPVSCYTTGAPDTCCGCENWSFTTASEQCQNQNATWLLPAIVNNIIWLKQAAPTAYSYPFDDKSSTFTCPATGTDPHIGAVNYTVTFCPGGNTGGVTPPTTD